MANKESKTVIQMDFHLTEDQMEYLASMLENDDTKVRRIQAVIRNAVTLQAAGGLMLSAAVLQKIMDSTGVDPAVGEDLIPFLANGTGRIDGHRIVKVLIDPAYETALKEIADLRYGPEEESGIDMLVKDTVEACMDNAWYEHLPNQPRHILMSEQDQAGLEELLGAKFANGTDLAALVRKSLGAEGGLFSEHAEEVVTA